MLLIVVLLLYYIPRSLACSLYFFIFFFISVLFGAHMNEMEIVQFFKYVAVNTARSIFCVRGRFENLRRMNVRIIRQFRTRVTPCKESL